MRILAAALIALSLASLGAARAADDDHVPYKVGFTVREFVPPAPYDWRGTRATHC